jgi:EAL domain-containing protein (putative c-di-GMP-specific phosphodiesterase class I)
MLEDPGADAVVGAVVAMAKPLGVTVVAEGVETLTQLTRLSELGCHQAQVTCSPDRRIRAR